MPRPWLVEAEFRNELIHLRVKLDDHFVGIVVIAGDVVARRVARGAPKLLDPAARRLSAATAWYAVSLSSKAM